MHSLSRLCTSIHSSALTQCIHPLVCITSTSIPASLRCTCFDIARQISQLVVDIQGKPHHRPHRTLRPTDRNINAPMSRTLTTEVPAGTINPITGHVNDDDVALYRAIGLDQPDPPSIGGTDRTTHVPFGWIRPQAGGMPEPRRYIYGGPPAGPFGPPGGGPPGRGPPGGGPPMPIPPAPVIVGGRNDKLVGNTPLIFKGECS
jgi:hypothetical protein